jgi:hypothetical protein
MGWSSVQGVLPTDVWLGNWSETKRFKVGLYLFSHKKQSLSLCLFAILFVNMANFISVTLYMFFLLPCNQKRFWTNFTTESIQLRIHIAIGFNIVMHMPIARQPLGKHIPEAYALNVRVTSIARQRTNKHALLTREDGVFRCVRADEL